MAGTAGATPPDAQDDVAITNEDVGVDIDVLANDSDPEGAPLTVRAVTQGANGTVAINPDGTVNYSPDEGFNGSDTFEYTVSDFALPETCQDIRDDNPSSGDGDYEIFPMATDLQFTATICPGSPEST